RKITCLTPRFRGVEEVCPRQTRERLPFFVTTPATVRLSVTIPDKCKICGLAKSAACITIDTVVRPVILGGSNYVGYV
ncbi:MAG: hypothetical protein KAJ46_05000, partial [Sedimentisphaerales bacterium]|nr:hypothetical protein [Sedimentisphaerales bacterium]